MSVPDDYLAVLAEKKMSVYGEAVTGCEFRIGSATASELIDWAKGVYGTFSDGRQISLTPAATMFGYPVLLDETLPPNALILREIEVHG